MQTFTAVLFILALLGLAGAFGWHQLKTLRSLRPKEEMPPEDWYYFRRQAYRRLFGCGLMLLLAVLLVGYFFVDERLQPFLAAAEKAEAEAVAPERLQEAEEDFVKFGLAYVFMIMVLVLLLIGVAMFDLMAIRRYGMRHRQRIREDRQAMLQRQLPQLRRSRNGPQ